MSEKWPQQIFKKMGIKILSFNIKELSDPTGYLDALGHEQTAKIKSKAAILTTAAERNAYVHETEFECESKFSRFNVDKEIADYEKDFNTKKVP